MSFRLHGYWAILLAVALGVSSGTAAVTRGKMRDISGAIVLCTGHGPLSVAVDGRGEPVEPLPICPEYLPAAVALIDMTPEIPVPVTISFARFRFPETRAVPMPGARTVRVRGPPVA